MSTKPSLKQISEITGYSIATVSNALSGNRGVSPEAAAQIYQCAKDTGYISIRKIRRVKLVALRTTGKIFDATPFFSTLLQGVSEECAANGYEMNYTPLEVDAPGFTEQLQKLQNDMLSAIILLGSEITGDEYRYFDGFTVPLVTLDYWCPNQRYNGVEINNFDAGRMVASYLIGRGHQRIGYLRGEWRIRAFHDRGRGFRDALHTHELTCPDAWIVTLGTAMDRAYNDMLAWLQSGPELPTAFFADDDIIALGAIKALQEKGIRVPQDVSVIGFDDLPYCTISAPSLTSMSVPAAEMGRMAVRRLRDVLEQRDSLVTRNQVSVTIAERDSVLDRTAAAK